MTEEAPKSEPRSEGKRLFAGIRVSLETANSLARAVDTLGRRARDARVELSWVPPSSYHVTLKFLGWTRLTAIDAVCDALVRGAAGATAFTFKTARLGAFPSLEKASVVWAGVDEPTGVLGKLAASIEAALSGIGYAAENRPFHPHVTIARARETRLLKELVLPVAEQMFGATPVDAVTLFESETKPTGSVYKEIFRIDFKTASNASSGVAERQTRALDLGAQHGLEDTDDGWPRGHH
ncbi:MAG: RNA 2',3'-cyclic phosphodiesterase [Deltaproteobacteria bacterium]|nr:RNA 2',3'-cyclic phosphodiesterase [Deltaproteobacteria bacterium]